VRRDEWDKEDRSPLLDDGTLNRFWPTEYNPVQDDTSRFDKALMCLTDNSRHRAQLEQFAAYLVRHPGEVMGYAQFIHSRMNGTGKSTYADFVAKVVGEHNRKEVTMKMLDDTDNSWAEHILLFTLNEALNNPRKDAKWLTGLMHNYIAKKGLIPIRRLYFGSHDSENHGSWIICTNSDSAVVVSENTRRFDVVHAREKRYMDNDTFQKEVLGKKWNPTVKRWEEDPEEDKRFFNALLYRLLHETDMTGFNPHRRRREMAG
jgi:hypothetical protein